jgi:hypothetical protein
MKKLEQVLAQSLRTPVLCAFALTHPWKENAA